MLSDPSLYIRSMVPSPEEEAGSLLNIDLDEALDQYVRERARLVKRLKELSLEDWQRTAEHEEYSHYSVLTLTGISQFKLISLESDPRGCLEL